MTKDRRCATLFVHFAVPHFNLRGHSCEFPWSCFPAPCKRGHSCNFACLFSVHIPWNRDSESLTRRKSVLSQNLKVDLLVVINLVINIHGSVPLAYLSDSYPANSLRSVVLASGKSPVLYVWSRSDEDRRPRVGGRYPLFSSLAGLKLLSIPLHCLSNMNLQLNLPLPGTLAGNNARNQRCVTKQCLHQTTFARLP
jgi:hypothetical protein